MRREQLDAELLVAAGVLGDEWATATMLRRLIDETLNLLETDVEAPTLQLVARRAAALAAEGWLERRHDGDVWRYRALRP